MIVELIQLMRVEQQIGCFKLKKKKKKNPGTFILRLEQYSKLWLGISQKHTYYLSTYFS